MLFNSYGFLLLFLPLAYVGWFVLLRTSRASLAIGFLFLASVVFYANWRLGDVPILLLSIVLNFLMARAMVRARSAAPIWLAAGVTINLAALAWFKYAGFVGGEIGRWLDIAVDVPHPLLPLAISFFTFQQISFLVDVRQRGMQPRFRDYAAAVSFFPHLIAGPIVRYRDLLPQLESIGRHTPGLQHLPAATTLFAIGLFKKTWLADPLGSVAAVTFAPGAGMPSAQAWVSVLAFALQIYFDFSGYTDMALGIARLFGIRLPQNFDSPYRAASIIDFWRRWHMTLSQFLRDYLYKPLGGRAHRYRNIAITMLLCGLWHGAGWTFVFWGALHGAALCVNHAWRALNRAIPAAWARVALIFFLLVSWVPFRARDFSQTISVWAAMFGIGQSGHAAGFPPLTHLALVAIGTLAVGAPWNSNRLAELIEHELTADRRVFAVASVLALVFAAGFAGLSRRAEFIYFNF